MEKGDFIPLCTDGLVNTVTDQEMLFEIVHGGDLDTCLTGCCIFPKVRARRTT